MRIVYKMSVFSRKFEKNFFDALMIAVYNKLKQKARHKSVSAGPKFVTAASNYDPGPAAYDRAPAKNSTRKDKTDR